MKKKKELELQYNNPQERVEHGDVEANLLAAMDACNRFGLAKFAFRKSYPASTPPFSLLDSL